MIDLLDHSCDVEAATTARDTSGGLVETWAAVVMGMPCQAEPLDAAAQVIFAQAGYQVTHEVFTTQSGILAGQRLNFHDGVYLRVRSVKPVRAQGGIDGFYRLLCEEVHVS